MPSQPVKTVTEVSTHRATMLMAHLGTDSLSTDMQCGETLEPSAILTLSGFIVTHVSIVTSVVSNDSSRCIFLDKQSVLLPLLQQVVASVRLLSSVTLWVPRRSTSELLRFP